MMRSRLRNLRTPTTMAPEQHAQEGSDTLQATNVPRAASPDSRLASVRPTSLTRVVKDREREKGREKEDKREKEHFFKDVSTWSKEAVCDWLQNIGYGEFKKKFLEEEVTGDVLLKLTQDDLKDLDINTLGQRKNVLHFIVSLQEENAMRQRRAFEIEIKDLVNKCEQDIEVCRQKLVAAIQIGCNQKCLRLLARHIDGLKAQISVNRLLGSGYSEEQLVDSGFPLWQLRKAGGYFIVTGSSDKTAKIWNGKSGKCIKTLRGYEATVTSVAFSQDNLHILTGFENRTVNIWSSLSYDCLSAFKCLNTFQGPEGGVVSGALSQDDRRILTSSDDNTATIWNSENYESIATLKGHEGKVLSVAFSYDHQRILTGSRDFTAKIWHNETYGCLATLKGHTSQVLSVAFSHDNLRILTASLDGTAKVWSNRTYKCLATLKGHKKGLTSIAFSHDDCCIVTGSADHTAKIWNSETYECLTTLHGHDGGVECVAFMT